MFLQTFKIERIPRQNEWKPAPFCDYSGGGSRMSESKTDDSIVIPTTLSGFITSTNLREADLAASSTLPADKDDSSLPSPI